MIKFKAKASDGEIINSALEPFFFPAGEAHTKLKEHREVEKIEIAIIQPSFSSIHDDLFALAMWSDWLARHPEPVHKVVVMPYFPGARQDRGEPYGLHVYSHFLSTLSINQLIIFDPHSPQTLLENSYNGIKTTAVYSDELFAKSYIKSQFSEYTGVIAPDAGAVIRAGAVAVQLGVPLYVATKKRNEKTGLLTDFALEALPEDGKYLLIDDICDGGRTFMGLAEVSGLTYDQLSLFVSHGVFSKDALLNLPAYFGKIYTTNSYNPMRDLTISHAPTDITRFDVIRLLLEKIEV